MEKLDDIVDEEESRLTGAYFEQVREEYTLYLEAVESH